MELKQLDKIYLLDDNMFYIHIFQQHLVNLGYSDIAIFNSPGECSNQLNPPPDIIFYVYGENFLEGLEVLKMIKRHTPDICMVFISGPDNAETVIQSLKYGAFDYFIKGDDDAKNIELVLKKIHRVRELLEQHNLVRFKKYSFNYSEELAKNRPDLLN